MLEQEGDLHLMNLGFFMAVPGHGIIREKLPLGMVQNEDSRSAKIREQLNNAKALIAVG
ncbi:hypothetical protein GCM10010136_31160 [Limoniibacter endophyticus]|uniref:Uncharacterized protein n=1 Tax=Limoniibacter endophyticus TaxID=1565040 RepID=A0A8J3DQ17_9HYPH|nr:hypothetical protein GCM10010136_31160 [Limoniibacter endophyticus]